MKINSFKIIKATSITLLGAYFAACGGGGSSAPVVSYPYNTVYSDPCKDTPTAVGCSLTSSGGSTGSTGSTGGSSSGSSGGSSSGSTGSTSGGGTVITPPIIVAPIGTYETVYGDVCSGSEPTPGCTFRIDNGLRATVLEDPHYNSYGYGSDDLWYVKFYSDGTGDVYNDLGTYQYTTNTSTFAGYISGNVIGVGTTGFFWENVAGGTYWLGKNGVLYNAMPLESNYGEAINTKDANEASDNNFAAIANDSNKALVKKGADVLIKNYGLSDEKAMAVASALNSWAVSAVTRGYTTEKDMDRTFTAVFGVEFSSALAAVKDLQGGEKEKMRDLTNRTASALGLQPHEAQKFIKGMYAQALADWGYNVENLTW